MTNRIGQKWDSSICSKCDSKLFWQLLLLPLEFRLLCKKCDFSKINIFEKFMQVERTLEDDLSCWKRDQGKLRFQICEEAIFVSDPPAPDTLDWHNMDQRLTVQLSLFNIPDAQSCEHGYFKLLNFGVVYYLSINKQDT